MSCEKKLGPAVEGTIIYKVGEQTHFKGAYITTSERMIMNVDMNGESYKRVFSYQDIVKSHHREQHPFHRISARNGKKTNFSCYYEQCNEQN